MAAKSKETATKGGTKSPKGAKKSPPAKTKSASATSGGKTAKEKCAEERFVKDTITRGEAVEAKKGKLPPGATHQITEKREGELPKIERKRFSAY